jgi:hypothetical protein
MTLEDIFFLKGVFLEAEARELDTSSMALKQNKAGP